MWNEIDEVTISMELREVTSFYHVAKLRSVSKAAKKLDLGQPTVTTHLRKLESEFSITLFDRIKRPIQLTSEGTGFLSLITPIVESVDTLKIHMDYPDRKGAFVVGAYPDLALHHLPESIQAFTIDYPDVHLRLVARSYGPLIQMVKSGEVDLALCSPPPADDPTLEFTELFQYNVVLMTPPGHELLDEHPVLLSKACAWPLLLAGPESQTRRTVEQALKDLGVNYNIVLEMDNTELIKRYVEIGMGIAIGADFTLHPEDHYKLGVTKLDHIFSKSSIGICTLKGKFMGRAVGHFMNNLLVNLKDLHPDIEEWEDTI